MGLVQKIIYGAVLMGGLGLLFGFLLALVERRFRVESDPRVDQIEELLPGLNCGACGQAGCRGAAEVVVAGADVGICPVGGGDVAEKIGDLLGRSAENGPSKKAIISCRPNLKNPPTFTDIETCLGYQTLIGSASGCTYGCIGLGDCAAVCPVGAITQNDNGQMEVDSELCIGCGLCVKACPRSVITLQDEGETLKFYCKNPEKGKPVLSVCSSGCIGCGICAKVCPHYAITMDGIGCGICAKVCPHYAITMDGNLPVINYDYCQDCRICVEKCPKSCLDLEEFTYEIKNVS